VSTPPHRVAGPTVELDVANVGTSQAIVRAFVVATGQAWSLGPEAMEACRIVANELFAWADAERVSFRLELDTEARTLTITCDPASVPELSAFVGDDGLRLDLLGALSSSVQALDRGVVVEVSIPE